MPSPYKAGGVNFDDLFDPDVVGDGSTAPPFKSGGMPIKYAAIQHGAKRANVGFRIDGVDVSNLWAAKGSATHSLPFDGQSFNMPDTAPSGSLMARVTLAIKSDGSYSITGESQQSGATAFATGTWLPNGWNASQCAVQFIESHNANAAVTNGASSYSSTSSTRSIASQSGPAAATSGLDIYGATDVEVRIRNNATGGVMVTNCWLLTRLAGV